MVIVCAGLYVHGGMFKDVMGNKNMKQQDNERNTDLMFFHFCANRVFFILSWFEHTKPYIGSGLLNMVVTTF